jgi:uncharacterized RDD family membrane protein YckC
MVVRDNPYAAPASALSELASGAPELELAGRGMRLAASIIDSIFGLLLWVPILVGIMMSGATKADGPVWIGMLVAMLLGIGVIAWNCVLVARNGQTIAKMLLGIKVVRRDGSPAGLARIFFARYLPVVVISILPLIGPIFALVDALLIFGDDRRCLHDQFADTIVVMA